MAANRAWRFTSKDVLKFFQKEDESSSESSEYDEQDLNQYVGMVVTSEDEDNDSNGPPEQKKLHSRSPHQLAADPPSAIDILEHSDTDKSTHCDNSVSVLEESQESLSSEELSDLSSVSTAPEELSTHAVEAERSNSSVEAVCSNSDVEFECSNNGVEFECSNNGVESECSNNSVVSECNNSDAESECSNSGDTSDEGNPLQENSVTIQQRQRRGHGRSRGRGHGRGRGRGQGRGRGRGQGRGHGRGGGRGGQQISVPRNVQSRLRYLEHVPSEAVPIVTNDDGFEEGDEFSPIRQVGLHLPTTSEDLSELDICQLFVTDEVIDRLVCSTNEYAERNKDKKNFQYRLFKLSPLTCDEMRRYLGVLLLLSISSIRSYRQAWDTNSSQVSLILMLCVDVCCYEVFGTFSKYYVFITFAVSDSFARFDDAPQVRSN